jgi:hypothetical protein
MNRLAFGEVLVAPDAFGLGRVLVGDADRLCYFDPTRFSAAFTPATVGERVAVYHDEVMAGRQWICLWVIGRGAPSYSYGGD